MSVKWNRLLSVLFIGIAIGLMFNAFRGEFSIEFSHLAIFVMAFAVLFEVRGKNNKS